RRPVTGVASRHRLPSLQTEPGCLVHRGAGAAHGGDFGPAAGSRLVGAGGIGEGRVEDPTGVSEERRVLTSAASRPTCTRRPPAPPPTPGPRPRRRRPTRSATTWRCGNR